MKRQNVRTLSLIVVTFTYLLFGAAIFDSLESKHENLEHKRLENETESLRLKYNISQEDFDRLKHLGIQLKPYKAGTQWKFVGALYFATTVITTIGYGHSTPKTSEGKIVCMCYAVLGIPLCLIMFQSIGERMNTIITWILRQIKKYFVCRNQNVSQTNLMIISFTTGSTVLTIGAAVFSWYESWSYLDSFYYCFITLTTIGFGDFVALQRDNWLERKPFYVTFSLIFILFGLTVVSSVMNLLVLRFLTMNTEDELRDQLEAAAQAQELQRLHGDVICNANMSTYSGFAKNNLHTDDNSSYLLSKVKKFFSLFSPRISANFDPITAQFYMPTTIPNSNEDELHKCKYCNNICCTVSDNAPMHSLMSTFQKPGSFLPFVAIYGNMRRQCYVQSRTHNGILHRQNESEVETNCNKTLNFTNNTDITSSSNSCLSCRQPEHRLYDQSNSNQQYLMQNKSPGNHSLALPSFERTSLYNPSSISSGMNITESTYNTFGQSPEYVLTPSIALNDRLFESISDNIRHRQMYTSNQNEHYCQSLSQQTELSSLNGSDNFQLLVRTQSFREIYGPENSNHNELFTIDRMCSTNQERNIHNLSISEGSSVCNEEDYECEYYSVSDGDLRITPYLDSDKMRRSLSI